MDTILKELAELKSQMNAQNAEITRLKTNNVARDAEITRLKTNNVARDAEIAAQNTEITRLKTNNVAQSDTITQLNRRVSGVEGTFRSWLATKYVIMHISFCYHHQSLRQGMGFLAITAALYLISFACRVFLPKEGDVTEHISWLCLSSFLISVMEMMLGLAFDPIAKAAGYWYTAGAMSVFAVFVYGLYWMIRKQFDCSMALFAVVIPVGLGLARFVSAFVSCVARRSHGARIQPVP